MGRGSLLSYSCFVSPFQAEARRPAPGTAVHRYLSSKPALEFKYVEATPGWERADLGDPGRGWFGQVQRRWLEKVVV